MFSFKAMDMAQAAGKQISSIDCTMHSAEYNYDFDKHFPAAYAMLIASKLGLKLR